MLQTAAHRPTLFTTLRQPLRPERPTHARVHPLSMMAERAGKIDGCVGTLIAGCDEPAMLMVERLGAGGKVAETWVVTAVTAATLRLEEMVAESQLALLAEGPPDHILSHMARLAARGPATAPPLVG